MDDTLEGSGLPLGFLVRDGKRPALLGGGAGKAVYVTECRLIGGHQKEALVQEGAGGPVWRLSSDEGAHLGDKDVAPFPLGFFNAGLQSDIFGRVAARAAAQGLSADGLRMWLQNYYWLTGSFIHGTGQGFADPPRIEVAAEAAGLAGVVQAALAASPAVDTLTSALPGSFALYINGRRENPTTLTASSAPDAPDPYLTHSARPVPLTPGARDTLAKTGEVEQGSPQPAANAVTGKLLRKVTGRGVLTDGVAEVDAFVEAMPGFTHFRFLGDERPEGRSGPSGLALMSAGIAFCFMTQLARYISNMKLDIGGVRLVQYSPFEVTPEGRGIAEPVDTHLFLNGRADAETHEMLLRVAARTCYLHAALSTPIPPEVAVL
jgi:uncharacterized OsmC-like protein